MILLEFRCLFTVSIQSVSASYMLVPHVFIPWCCSALISDVSIDALCSIQSDHSHYLTVNFCDHGICAHDLFVDARNTLQITLHCQSSGIIERLKLFNLFIAQIDLTVFIFITFLNLCTFMVL